MKGLHILAHMQNGLSHALTVVVPKFILQKIVFAYKITKLD